MVNRSSLIIEPTQGRRSYRRVLALPRILNPERLAEWPVGGGEGSSGSLLSPFACARTQSRVPASRQLPSLREASRYADKGREIVPRYAIL